jgi:hypothetical protein
MFEEQFNVPKTRNENINEIELVAPYLKALRRVNRQSSALLPQCYLLRPTPVNVWAIS